MIATKFISSLSETIKIYCALYLVKILKVQDIRKSWKLEWIFKVSSEGKPTYFYYVFRFHRPLGHIKRMEN